MATSIDGVNANIPEHFRDIYSKLYNSAESMAKVSIHVEDKINSFSISHVMKVTPDIVKSAAKKLKSGKTYPVYIFSSDCIKVESDLLAELLADFI